MIRYSDARHMVTTDHGSQEWFGLLPNNSGSAMPLLGIVLSLAKKQIDYVAMMRSPDTYVLLPVAVMWLVMP